MRSVPRRPGASALGLLVAMVVPAASVQAEDPPTLTVDPGDSCAAIASRWAGPGADAEARGRALAALHRANPQLGRLPHHLEPGTLLRVPAAFRPDPQQEPPARVEARRGSVESREPGQPYTATRVGEALALGGRLRTGRSGFARLRFRLGGRVSVRERTLLTIGPTPARSRRRRARLATGALRARLGELAGVLAVDTPAGAVRVGAGDTVVGVDDEGRTTVSNVGDRVVEVEVTGRRVRLAAEEGITVDPGPARTRRARRLRSPRAPRWNWDGAAPRPVIALPSLGGAVDLSWRPDGPSPRRYRVTLSRDPAGLEVVVARELPGTRPWVRLHGVAPGAYYARVSALGHVEGPPSRAQVVVVGRGRLRSPGGRRPMPVQIAEGWVLVPTGTLLVPPAGWRCAAENDATTTDPRAAVTGGTGDRVMVSCVDPRGRPTPPVGFELVPSPSEGVTVPGVGRTVAR